MPRENSASTSTHVSPHLLNDAGSWKYTNRLAYEASPYLLQHAHNPVDWYPWGLEAFKAARTQGKPLFVSIGYATCYWCHVMERQSFENPDIAALMNELFINVKVDREQRPDVDDLYMTATQLVSGASGWPMSVFLTPPGAASENDPGLKPFYAGTYFPPTPAHGRPGFADVVSQLAQAWRQQRSRVIEQAQRIAAAVREHATSSLTGQTSVIPSWEMVAAASRQLVRSYDRTHGGFGGAPKFPQPSQLLFLTRFVEVQRDDDVMQTVAHTLTRMACGGMYDQVSGGFHRYSVDEAWLVPHFEKMLYDNAQLIPAYLHAARLMPAHPDADFWRRVARETADWVLGRMTDDTGAFWSAMDAEVNAREGGSYIWTVDQVRAAIDEPRLAELALAMYGLDRGPNFRDPHHPTAEAANVLYLPDAIAALAERHSRTESELVAQREQINRRLLIARDQRDQPITDDKVLTEWNGMMIAALADAGRELDEPRYRVAARAAADAVLAHMSREDGGLHRTMRDGRAEIPAFLNDYAQLAHGLLALHHALADPHTAGPYLDHARRLMAYAERHFLVAADTLTGGYYDTLADQTDLFVRGRGFHDGAIPSGNSQMVHNWITLYEITGDRVYLDKAARDLRSFGSALRQHGASMIHMQHALLRALMDEPSLFERVNPPADTHIDQVLTAAVTPTVIACDAGAVTLRIELSMAPGHHINGPTTRPDLVPTTLSVAGHPDSMLEVAWPPPVLRRYLFADQPLPVYEGTVTLSAVLTSTTARPRTLHLLLGCQPCTGHACLAPRKLEIPLRIGR